MLLFGFGTAFYVILLLTNAIAILSEERFLHRVGLGPSPANEAGIRARIVMVFASVRTLLRIPLVVFNLAVILWELLLG